MLRVHDNQPLCPRKVGSTKVLPSGIECNIELITNQTAVEMWAVTKLKMNALRAVCIESLKSKTLGNGTFFFLLSDVCRLILSV